jgi:glucosylceramidase
MKLLVLFLVALVAVPAHSQVSIDVDHTSLYQEFYGCGASWTDSSAWLMYGDRSGDQYRSLTDTERDAIFSDLFGSDGIALKVVRQPMGTSDFRWSDYTYQDDQGGTFSIARDKSYIIPTLARTLVENDKVKVMALPWSPPAWMKQNGSLYGGSIKSDAYDDLAQYFADFVQAYEAEGIPIWAVSIQNEPMHESGSYPTMGMTESEHAQAIVAVRAALDSAIKVVGYDHNW